MVDIQLEERLKNFDNPDKILLLTYGGSHSYGTNTETSDIDIRGICGYTKEELLIMSTNKRAFVDPDLDTVIYYLNQMRDLLIDCNPNTIEILGCKPEHYHILSEGGKLLLDNKRLFLSKKAARSFGGYANSQLRRLQNTLVKNVSQSDMECHIKNSLENSLWHLKENCKGFSDIGLTLDLIDSEQEDIDIELVISMHLDKFPVRQLQHISKHINGIVNPYRSLVHREVIDTKKAFRHASHLIRLYLMCKDILLDGEINTYRENDTDLLLAIKNGHIPFDDIIKMVDVYEKEMPIWVSKSKLPDKVDIDKINSLVADINEIMI